MIRRAVFLAVVCSALFACAGGGPTGTNAQEAKPTLSSVDTPIPLLPGSIVRAHGTLVGTGDVAVLTFEDVDTHAVLELSRAVGALTDELLFELAASEVGLFGLGIHTVDVVLHEGSRTSDAIRMTVQIETTLPITLTPPASARVHRNDAMLVRGNGFLGAGEGEVTMSFVGTYTRTRDGDESSINTSLPVTIADLAERDRGLVVLTTALGGIEPGVFDGSVTLRSRLHEGTLTASDPAPITLTFVAPEVFSFSPATVSLGAFVRVAGAGFVGGADTEDEVTTLRVHGTFTDSEGLAIPFADTEVVPDYVSGAEVRFPLSAVARDGFLVSELFGATRGTFEGEITPVTVKGTTEIVGDPAPVSLTLGPVTQVVYIRFLPGYYDSLLRFGLAQASSEIASQIVSRVVGIFADYAVDVRLDVPEEYPATGYSIVDIGGTDPNGRGYFGYDNSPGKDVGNLRLYDALGGVNAERQADGFPGYGGIFVESLLYYSANPGLEPPAMGAPPDPDPAFDEVFSAVRIRPATVDEVRGIGSPDRLQAVTRAIRALGAVIGETVAHELGHSFGLAQPYGDAMAYHDAGDEPGCLMEFGTSRPFTERAELDGAEPTHLCADAPEYLSTILGR